MRFITPGLLTLLLTSHVFANEGLDRSFFGLEFGTPLQAVPCVENGKLAVAPLAGYCIQPMSASGGPGSTGNARVKFAAHELPYWTGGQFVVELIDGKLEGVVFGTAGVASRETIMSALTKKYGQPHRITPMPMQNKFGAQFDGSVAQWSDSGLTVTYTPIRGDLREGQLQVFTPPGAAAFDKRMKDIYQRLEAKREL